MLEVFIDEAGDLGFKDKSSRMLVIAYAIIAQPQRTRGDLIRLRKKIHQRHKQRIDEFKFSRDTEYVRSKVLKEISNQDLTIGYFVADKKFVREGLRKEPRILYNYVVVDNVITNLVRAYDLKEVKFVIDRSLSKEGMEHFNSYLTNKLSWRQVNELGREMPRVIVSHEDSRNDQCLQVVDYCAGAAFNYFERNNPIHYEFLRPRIRFTNGWGQMAW